MYLLFIYDMIMIMLSFIISRKIMKLKGWEFRKTHEPLTLVEKRWRSLRSY